MEVPLEGGYVNQVVRVGDTVRRTMAEPRPFPHEVLTFLDRRGWPGAPRFLGVDDLGREVLTYIDGHVPGDDAEATDVSTRDAIARVAELTRSFHDLTAGSRLAGHAEVVCHNDLSPANTVHRLSGDRRLEPVAFIDWDPVAPGRRIHDVAHVCWQWACRATARIDVAAELVGVAAGAYGCTVDDRADLVPTILWWQDRCWRGIQAKLDAGEPSAARLREVGAVDSVRADWVWTYEHRVTLEAAVRS